VCSEAVTASACRRAVIVLPACLLLLLVPGVVASPRSSAPPLKVQVLLRHEPSGRPALAVAHFFGDHGRYVVVEASWTAEGDVLVCWWGNVLWRWDSRAGWRQLVSGVDQPEFLGWLSHPRRLLMTVDEDTAAWRVVALDPQSGKTQVLANEKKSSAWFETGEDRPSPGLVRCDYYDIAVAPDGGLVAVFFEGPGAAYVRFFDGNGRTVGANSPGFAISGVAECHAYDAGWSPDGKTLAVLPRDSHTLFMIEPRKARVRNEWFRDYPNLGVWSPCSDTIAFVATDEPRPWCCCWYGGTLALFDVPSGKVRRFPQIGDVQLPVWSPDGQRLAIVTQPEAEGPTRFVGVFDVGTGTVHRPGSALPDLEFSPQWSPDGRFVGMGKAVVDSGARRVAVAQRGQSYLPAKAAQGSWVWRVEAEEWVQLGKPYLSLDERGDEPIYEARWWRRYGSTQPTRIGSGPWDDFWCCPPAPEGPDLPGQIGRPPG
jgi:hypothetical protein